MVGKFKNSPNMKLSDLDSEIKTQFPDSSKNAIGKAYSLAHQRLTQMDNSQSWPLSMKCSFIEPGVVNYADVGMVYVKKETLDKMANSFIGKPVINTDHRDVSPEDFENGTAQGIINSIEAQYRIIV